MNIQVLLQTDVSQELQTSVVGSPITFPAHAVRFTTREDVITVWECTHALKSFWNLPWSS